MRENKYNPHNNSGSYRHRISIFKRTITVDELFQETELFEHVCKLWSMIKTLKGQETTNATTESINTSRFIVRYSKFLNELFKEEKTSFEIHYKGITYDVKSVINDDEMNETFTIIAEGRL